MKSAALLASLTVADAGSLNLAWKDCGSPHGKVTGLSPTSLPLGTQTKLAGSGTVDEAVSGGTFEIDLKASIISQKFTGDLCASKSFPLPLGTGTITWDSVKCPVAAGAMSVPVDVKLSSTLPAALQKVTMTFKGADTSGSGVFCMEVDTSPAENEVLDYSEYTFEHYKKEFAKAYHGEEHSKRKAIFDKNLEKVKAHNEEYQKGHHTWFAAMNHLADATDEEFKVLRAAKKYIPSGHTVVALQATAPNPDSIDWRTKNAVTPVKNQGGCGSCWAFSATETVESAYAIASGKLLTLAPQTYVNCVKNPSECGGTGGCEGATMELAFNLTAQTGIALESDLPYRGSDAACKPYKAAVKATGYVKNPTNDAKGLETAVATKGPQAITVAAEPWQLYGGGVFTGCSSGIFKSNDLDHGVQLVGYTQDYWIVRNSWGAGWGESGYIRVSRANDAKTFVDTTPADGVACKPYPKTQTIAGECGILFDTSYPSGLTAGDSEIIV